MPVRKQKGVITSVLLSSFANKENKIERLTFDSNSRNAKMNANNEFYIGNVVSFLFLHTHALSISLSINFNLLRLTHQKSISIKLSFACRLCLQF